MFVDEAGLKCLTASLLATTLGDLTMFVLEKPLLVSA